MPIILTDLDNKANTQAVKTYSPKFFDSKLTGNGKNTGLLKEQLNPKFPTNDKPTASENFRSHKRQFTNGSITTTYIPMDPIGKDGWDVMCEIDMPDLNKVTRIGVDNKYELYIDMKPYSLTLEEITAATKGQSTGTTRRIAIAYQIFLYNIYDKSKTEPQYVSKDLASRMLKRNENTYTYVFTCSPHTDLTAIVNDLSSTYTINPVDVMDWLEDYDLHTAICERSEQWQTYIDKTLDTYFKNLSKSHTAGSMAALCLAATTLRKIEDYSVPLDLYRNIYKSVQTHFSTKDATELCKQNLNLLLSDTLNSLHTNRANLTQIPGPPVNMTVPPSVKRLSPEQYAAVSSTNPLILVQSGAGTGKALELTAPVLTPRGWTTMGELKVGDEVIGSDGKPHKVLRIHEQGLKPGYHLTFRDGSTINACGEHLWTVLTNDTTPKKAGKPPRRSVITTEEWIHSYHRTHSYLPIVQPVEYAFGEKDLPLDPYFLGALLADGCLGQHRLQYTKSETAVYEETAKAANRSGFTMHDATYESSTAKQWYFSHPDDKVNCSKLRTIINTLGLNIKSREKFIPDEYKTASISQRKALLNGLFDGDGDIRTGRGYARFNTASDQMAEDVLQLLWSLGLSATKQRQKHSRGDYWSVNLLDASWDPFIASEYKGKATWSVRPMRRSLVKAEPFEPVPMRCIEVDAPDKLYVTKDFIVTHNSTVILSRIDYMIAAGVQPEDITVLSFTNAAANHISERNNRVHSMTIARMIHTIYEKNFPTHELSSLETILNSLDIYFPTNDAAKRFMHYCKLLLKNDNNAFTAMNNFIESNYDEVIKMLDTIRQTSLELEIIICYQKIDTLQEPPEVQSKYLIIDEVQDNSIFEFVYTLKYVDKHKESLFIVGRLQLPTLNPTNCGKPTHK